MFAPEHDDRSCVTSTSGANRFWPTGVGGW